MTSQSGTVPKPDYYERNAELGKEIIEGLFREKQIVALAGAFGMGKTPALCDLAVRLIRNLPWCGRRVTGRRVVVFDLESPAPMYKQNVLNISHRLDVARPQVPDELDAHLLLDDAHEAGTEKLLVALEGKPEDRLALIKNALQPKPNALVIIDPVEVMFPIDKMKGRHILWLYKQLRILLSEFPEAAFLLTFNLRKRDRKNSVQPKLLSDPRSWLEEVSGTLDILNRCDVRLGLEMHSDDIRIVNGIRRGETIHPLAIRPMEVSGNLAGFELCGPHELDLLAALTSKQREHLDNLPDEFRFDDVADKIVPRASLYRLLPLLKSLGVVDEINGIYHKMLF